MSLNVSDFINKKYKKFYQIKLNLKKQKNFIYQIENIFNKNNKININEIDNNINKIKISKDINFKSIIHIGFTLNSVYVLQTMLTITSIMINQYKTTKIIFHLGVIKNFTSQNIIKIYELKRKFNNLTEFNFYYLNGAMKKMRNFHKKGEACPGKFELPELLPDNIERLLIFDAGDVLVFRDLTELYNYDMKDYWALGTPEPIGIYICSKLYNITKYLNIGSILLNVKELKRNKFWDKYTKKRNIKLMGSPDQTLFNIIVPDNKKDYFPFRFGGLSPFKNDKYSDNIKYASYGIKEWLKGSLVKSFPENPKTLDRAAVQLFNPVFIHQYYGKWEAGTGLSIYRNLVKYFIKSANIWEEICKIKPGYCK